MSLEQINASRAALDVAARLGTPPLPTPTGSEAVSPPSGAPEPSPLQGVLQPEASQRPALQPVAEQARNIESPAAAALGPQNTTAAPRAAGGETGGVEAAFLKVKDFGDKPLVKALTNLVTGEGHAYAKFDEGITLERRDPTTGRLTSHTRDVNLPKLQEVAGGIGWGVRQAASASDRITKSLNTAAKNNALKDSVSSVPAGGAITHGVLGTNAALAGVVAVKQNIELARDTVLDIAAAKDRSRLHELLKQHDVATGLFRNAETGALEARPELKAEMEALVNKKGGDRSRSHGQAAADRLTQVKDAALANTSFASGVLLTVGKDAVAASLGKAASTAVPGLGIAVNGLAAANATWKAATNITALNNVRFAAEQAKEDPLFAAVAAHVQQERIYNSRKHLLGAATNATTAALGAAALAAGPGAPAALAVSSIVGASITTAAAIGTAAWDVGHSALLAKRRQGTAGEFQAFQTQLTEALKPDQQRALWANLAKPENIGVAERALMSKLRSADPEESGKAVKFLQDFGLTKQTIHKLKVMGEKNDGHLKALQAALYNDKVAWSAKGAAYSLGSLGRVVGVVQLAGAIKGAYQRFAQSDAGLTLQSRLESGLSSARGWARDKLGDKADTGPLRRLLYERHNPLSRVAQGKATAEDHAWLARHAQLARVSTLAQSHSAHQTRLDVVDVRGVEEDHPTTPTAGAAARTTASEINPLGASA